jgi:hypothetical protein
MNTVRLQDMTWIEVSDRLADGATAVIPFGYSEYFNSYPAANRSFTVWMVDGCAAFPEWWKRVPSRA